ncbi:hypothetical protein [[Mycoplasma] collis]|uniref:hypothetical protein n=1 Tax=[Mycoplasma] collis TaxID=2127 RepID=UPI00051C6FD9|nr:hypothetical protein [[Mycoplasma] collis]
MNYKIKKTLLLFSSILVTSATFISSIACSKDDNQGTSSKNEEEIKKANMEADALKNKLKSFEATIDLLSNEQEVKLEELDNIISVLEDDSEKTLEDKIVDVLKIEVNEKANRQNDINNIKKQIENLYNLDKTILKTKIEELKVLREKHIPIYKTEEAKKLISNISALSFDKNDNDEIKKFKIEVIKMVLDIKNLLKNKTDQEYEEISEHIETLVLFLEDIYLEYHLKDVYEKLSNDKIELIEKVNYIVDRFIYWTKGLNQNLKFIKNKKNNIYQTFITPFQESNILFFNILKIFNKMNEKITSDKSIYEKITAELKSYLEKYTIEGDEFAIDINNDTSEEKIAKSYLLYFYENYVNIYRPYLYSVDEIINFLEKIYLEKIVLGKIENTSRKINDREIDKLLAFSTSIKKEELLKIINKFKNLKQSENKIKR